jgi:2,3-bisphosphoglycerate-independent phosphoglycerate mutase
LVEPDHRTTLATRAHAHGAVPFAACGTGIAAAGQSSYDEPTAAASPLSFDPGWGLMRWFLGR